MAYWTNYVNEEFFDRVPANEPKPLCGLVEYYELVHAKGDGTAGDVVTEIDWVITVAPGTGDIELKARSDNRALNDTFIDVFIQAFNYTADDERYGDGLSNKFRIDFYAEPDAILYSPPDVTVDTDSVTVLNSDVTSTDVKVTASATDLALDQVSFDLGTASDLVIVSTTAFSTSTISLLLKVTPKPTD
jgi:hypothetical protein